MVTAAAGVSNLGLDSVGMLLSIPKWSTIGVLGRRGSSRAGGLGGGIGRRGERCVGERLNRGGSFVQRWRRRRRGMFDGLTTFRSTAADDVEQEDDVVEEDTDEAASAGSSSSSLQRDHELSSKEIPKIPQMSRIEQKQQRTSGGKLPGTRARIPDILSSIVEEWTSFTSVREKGDVRDVVLMSLSFAVLIYISQHLVHAYCTFRHMYFNHY